MLPHCIYHRSSSILLRNIEVAWYSAIKSDVALSIPVCVSSYRVEELWWCRRVYASSLSWNIATLFYCFGLSPARCESSHSFTFLPILVRIFNILQSGGCQVRVFITLITLQGLVCFYVFIFHRFFFSL